MKGEFDMYENSRISLVSGYNAPDDDVLMGAVISAPMSVLSMALHLVQGEDANPVNLTYTETNDVAVLVAILPFLQSIGLKDIHKVLNITMFMLRRWNESFQDAVDDGILEDTKGVSRDEFEGMMGM